MLTQEKRSLPELPELHQVDQMIQSLIEEFTADDLRNALIHHFSTGGKRLRARLGIQAVRALGGSDQNGIVWGAACEILHNATLIHDDLQDGDRMRRGAPTVWAKYGASQAINAGDSCLMFATLALRGLATSSANQWSLAQVLAERSAVVIRGQASELELPRFLGQGEELKTRYLRCIAEKTSALFELPVVGAGLLSGFDIETAKNLGEALRPLGVLFQMQDDVLDLYGAKGRDMPGGDLREGKVSCLVVEHIAAYPQDVVLLRDLLKKERGEVQDSEVEFWVSRFQNAATLKVVLKRIRELESKILMDVSKSAPRLSSIVGALVEMALHPIDHVFKMESI